MWRRASETIKVSGADLSLDRPAINDTSAETYPAEEKS
jgi:hypothetical protein